MATWIKANGEHVDLGAVDLPLTRMRELVGGHIELVTLSGTKARREMLIVNEEGLCLGLPPNLAATILYRMAGGADVVVGDVIRATCIDGGLDTERWE